MASADEATVSMMKALGSESFAAPSVAESEGAKAAYDRVAYSMKVIDEVRRMKASYKLTRKQKPVCYAVFKENGANAKRASATSFRNDVATLAVVDSLKVVVGGKGSEGTDCSTHAIALTA